MGLAAHLAWVTQRSRAQPTDQTVELLAGLAREMQLREGKSPSVLLLTLDEHCWMDYSPCTHRQVFNVPLLSYRR